MKPRDHQAPQCERSRRKLKRKQLLLLLEDLFELRSLIY